MPSTQIVATRYRFHARNERECGESGGRFWRAHCNLLAPMNSLSPSVRQNAACRIGMNAAGSVLLGIVLSGPLSLFLVEATHPQPAWRSAQLFARSYHPIQMLPYLGGIVLVGALIVLLASLHALARDDQQALTASALVFTAAFAALICFNYVVQTTFLPALARTYEPGSAPIIAALSMVNPTSLAWAIEMWGWALLGVATWLVAPVFGGSRLERATALACAANGPVSIAGAVWTVARPGWVMTTAGMAMFVGWNALLAVAATLVLFALRKRRRAASAGTPAVSASTRRTAPSAWG